MLDLVNKSVIILTIVLGISACEFSTKEQDKTRESKQYTGWWIYGEEQHIFKDETTLGEWGLTFPNENIEEFLSLRLT